MKKKTLVLEKQVIADLSKKEMNELVGGILSDKCEKETLPHVCEIKPMPDYTEEPRCTSTCTW